MALRDRQISGVPLPWGPAMALSVLMVLCVPVLGYQFWYPVLHIPEELRPILAAIGMGLQIHIQVGRVPVGVERAQQFFGRPTGISYPAGIFMQPRLPSPVLTILMELAVGKEIFQHFLWTLVGDVPIKSVVADFYAEGLTRKSTEEGRARVGIGGKLRIEIENAATYLVQDLDAIVAGIVAEYVAGVKASVISQHTVTELMQGYHSAGSSALVRWMTDTWRLVGTYGMGLESVMLGEVKILSKQVEHAFDLDQAQETFVGAARTVGEIIAELKRKHPNLSDTEVAMMYSAILKDAGVNVNVHNVNVK